MRLRGHHYRTGQKIELTCAEGKVTSIGPPTLEPVDFESGWIAPGFFDHQLSEIGGIAFAGVTTLAQVADVVVACQSYGISGFLPTFSPDAESAIAIFAKASSDPGIAPRIPGLHLRNPSDWDQVQRSQNIAEGRIRLATISLDQSRSIELIERLTDGGIATAICAANASAAQIRAAIDAGARLTNDLGSNQGHFSDGFWEQLATDSLWAGITRVSEQLPTAVMRSLIRAKGTNRCVLTSPMVAHVAINGGTGLADAVDMASLRPREMLGLPAVGIDVGSSIDFVLFEWDEARLNVQRVVTE